MADLFQNIQFYADTVPNRVALVGRESNGERVEIGYRQLWQDIQILASTLQAWEVNCIALLAENSVAWAKIDLAALYAGITLVPVPTFFSHAQIDHLMAESGVDLMIGNWHVSGALADASLCGQPCYFRHLNDRRTDTMPQLEGVAKITFTSGSTGSPKGVALSKAHIEKVTASLAHQVAQEAAPERHLVALPLSTLLENITGIYVPLFLGVESVVVEGGEIGLHGSSEFNPEQFAQAMLKYQPHSLVITPMFLMALVAMGTQVPQILSSLRFVAVGGARVPTALMTHAEQLGLPVYEGYGLSECGSVVSLNTPQAKRRGSVGKPLPHCLVSIAPDGEILVFGASMQGYIGAEPWDDAPIYTGDLGYRDDEGYLYVTGRKKNLLITAFGRNVSPEWIESEAMSYPHLRQMVVLGEGCATLSAVISTTNREAAMAEVEQLNALLPDYAAIGHLIFSAPFSTHRGLLTANGRPKRAQFVETFAQYIPATHRLYAQRKQITFSVDDASPATVQG